MTRCLVWLQSVTPSPVNKPTIVSVAPDADSVEIVAAVADLPGWEVVLELRRVRARASVVAECQLRPAGGGPVPDGGIRTEMLRRIPVAAIVRAAFDNPDTERSVGWLMARWFGGDAAADVVTAREGRNRGRDDLFYAQVALDWERLTAEGNGARRRLADERGEQPSTVKNWITEATRRGLLTEAGGTGVRARRATPLARKITEQAAEEG